MIPLLLGACDAPATAWPVDPCRIGAAFDGITADVTCAAAGHTVEARFQWADATRAGGSQGEGWDGLSFYATGTTAAGGTLSVGNRAGGLGIYAREAERELVVGYIPAGADWASPVVVVTDGEATCNSATGTGTLTLAGLPEDWVEGGVWTTEFADDAFAGDSAAPPAPPWPGTCPISPASWSSVRVSASCAGVEHAAVEFHAPASYAVELDGLGQVASASATWPDAYSAACDGGTLPALDGSLQVDDGAVRLYTPVLTVVRDAGGAWAVESTECGACDAWEVAVEGLPDF